MGMWSSGSRLAFRGTRWTRPQLYHQDNSSAPTSCASVPTARSGTRHGSQHADTPDVGSAVEALALAQYPSTHGTASIVSGGPGVQAPVNAAPERGQG